jgi:hypothetical protein
MRKTSSLRTAPTSFFELEGDIPVKRFTETALFSGNSSELLDSNREVAIDLISFTIDSDDNTIGNVTDEGKELLSNLTSLNGVVTVMGVQREGKSTLLNLLIGRPVFPTSEFTEPCTQGIRAFFDHSKGILYLDTQGLFDYNLDDKVMVVVALLLSNALIFNMKGIIDKKKIETMSLGVNLAQTVFPREAELRPILIWTERDTHLNLGEFKDETAYLKDMFGNLSGSSKAVNERNQVRQTVREYFPQQHYVRLPMPIEPENLPNVSHLPRSKLHNVFSEGIDRVKKLVTERLQIWRK